MKRLLDFIRVRGNHYLFQAPFIKLHNLITGLLADDAVARRLLHLMENGDRLVKEFRNEQFVLKKNKLSFTISKRNLLQLDYNRVSEMETSAVIISAKMTAAAQRDIDIAKERGMDIETIYSHDVFPISPIFEGDLSSKPDKSGLVSSLEKNLSSDDMVFQGGDTVVILDFMSKIRSFPNLLVFQNFGRAINWVFFLPVDLFAIELVYMWSLTAI